MSYAPVIFDLCVRAIIKNELIRRKSASDKEFHFQDWFEERLQSSNEEYFHLGRNKYPDFILSRIMEGYEVKGLAYAQKVARQTAKKKGEFQALLPRLLPNELPDDLTNLGTRGTVDGNSQVPRGSHGDRDIYYVFGRYPKDPEDLSYPVMDLVICHGSFLNANNTYIHKNKSFRGFGSYGDILVRDRKMYVFPTPYALAEGIAHYRTLIVREAEEVPESFMKVGRLVRREAETVVGSYSFDLGTNELMVTEIPNPDAGREHVFSVYRAPSDALHDRPVSLRDKAVVDIMIEAAAREDDC